MKALILAGGRGKRMEQLSESENKCMLLLHGKHLIEYSLDSAAAIPEVAEIVIVVGYRAENIINRFGTFFKGKQVRYVIQKKQAGVVHAMDCAKGYIGNDDFFLFLGDEVILGGRHAAMLDLMRKENLFCVCGVSPQNNLETIKRTYSLIYGPDDWIYRLIEKPRKPFNALMGTGNILFRHTIFDYVDFTPINLGRGEKELPDLIQCAIDDGERVKLFQVCDRYININSIEEWREVEDNWPSESIQARY